VLLAESSVSKDSKNAGELLWLGQLLGRSGKAERAGDVLQRAVEAGPKQQETWLALFSHHLSLGQRKSAENVLTRAMNELPEPERQLVAAQCEEMLGRIDDAERSYRQAVAVAPDGTSVARGLAAFLLRRGRLKPAREELERIVASTLDDPLSKGDRVWARRALAGLMADRGSYKSLEDALSMLAKNAGPDGQLATEDLVLQISMLASRPEPASWRSAIALLEKLSQTQPLSTDQRLQLARLLEKAGRWEDCRNELMTLVASPNPPPTLQALLVEKLIEHGELSTAKTWLTKVRASAPDAPLTLSLESKLAMAENDRPAAVAAVKKLMPSGPVSADRVGQLAAIAKLLEDLGFPKAADKLLTEFASLSKEGMAVRAEFLGRNNRPDEALDLLQQAWDDIPLERTLQTAISIARSKGSVLEGADSDRLEQWFAKARRQDPDSVTVMLLLAELRELQGRSAEVADLYRNILGRKDLAPTQTAIVANNLAFYLAKPETAAEAKKLIDAAIAELGPHPDLLDTRALIHLAVGENRLAVADLEESILVPTPVKYLHLACAQLAAKQTDAARKSLLQAKKMGLQPDRLAPADKERLQRVEDSMKAPLGA
jgi:cellulose synthase operon protein C